MAVGWFIAPYKLKPALGTVVRYCAMDDYTPQINADDGAWSEVECMGTGAGATIVKVRANPATLTTIAADPLMTRLPVALLDNSLSSLTNPQKTGIANKLQSLGFTAQDITTGLPGNLGTYTLRDLLKFVVKQRRDARFDVATQKVVCDGVILLGDPTALELADIEVSG